MRLLAAVAVAAALGAGLLVLQRWVAETRIAAMILVGAWFAVVGVATLIAVRARPALRAPALLTYAAIAVATAGIGYWTGFRDREVDENVIVATRSARGAERAAALKPAARAPGARDSEPVRLLAGSIEGADGHTAAGRVAVVRAADGTRRLTLTGFDADPGPAVVVYLSPDTEKTDDVVELGDLKGNVGDQQYAIPAEADLSRYDTLILWCVPFTTRIAVAPLT
jgi:electron transfer DM13